MVAPIELRDASRTYGRGAQEVRALDGASFSIADGEFVAIMGPSGSGKSTCLNVLGALDVLSSGEYLFQGLSVGRLSSGELALLRRHYFGFVFQTYNLVPRTSALENVELPLVYQRVSRSERRHRARQALEEVGLAGRERHTASELSGGQQQRVAIARALVTRPRLLLADEPTGNLDTAMKNEIMELLARANRRHGLTVVMVTHEPDMAAFASRSIHFRDGRIACDERRTP